MNQNVTHHHRGFTWVRGALLLGFGAAVAGVLLGNRKDAVAEASAGETDLLGVVCCQSGGMCTVYEGSQCPAGSSSVACPCQIWQPGE
mgnify:CR=1 FL=1